MPASVLIFWNVVTNEAQGSFVHTCLVPEELGWLLEGIDSSVSCPWPGVGVGSAFPGPSAALSVPGKGVCAERRFLALA